MDKINQAYQRVCAAYQTHMALDEDAEPMTHGQWFGAGYQAGQADTALQPSAWISCAERLPTEADADCDSYVWAYNSRSGTVGKAAWSYIEQHWPETVLTHWMPTGLTRPQPPEGV